ncbi:hypothetical protein [uncultured Winogradskyella sp.]|uniref:hypothetical protein n=1 Tax=uncultured Winogradskyella sp. TaxID=395353 RepID=UPI0030D6E38C|tara:strand:- start:4917 stop:5246 length:330 start_codon:yes stop_codon:yes gene_type:complete
MSSINWTKKELKIYILLLCANANSVETAEEIKLIKSKTDSKTFDEIYKVFSNHNEDESLEIIDDNIHQHEYSDLELAEIKREISELFLIDNAVDMKEKNITRILDNILY